MADILDIFNLEPSVISRDLKGKYILLYGMPKVGKSTFGSMLPRSLFLAFENGLNAISGVRSVPMIKWSDFKKVLKQLKDAKAREMYDSIVVDTTDIAWTLCEQYICQREGVNTIRDIQWGQGWGMVKQEFQECFRQLSLLGYGILFIAHSKERQSEFVGADGNPIMQQYPRLPSNAIEVVNGMVDIIGYVSAVMNEDGTSERFLCTRATPTVFAGSRYKYLEPKIPFGYNELVNAIGDAIEKSVAIDGAAVVDHLDVEVTKSRPFAEVLEDAKKIWMSYLDGADDDEEKENRFNVLNDIVVKVFGKPIKLSSALPSQQDLVELFIAEANDLI